MKIDRVANAAVRGSRPGAPRRAEKSDSFFRALSEAEASQPGPPGAAAPPPGVDALLALQEVPAQHDSDSRGRRRGEDLLERLDELHLALLTGRLSVAAIQRLADLVAARHGQVRDPRLAEILDEIELRAAVELAKLGR